MKNVAIASGIGIGSYLAITGIFRKIDETPLSGEVITIIDKEEGLVGNSIVRYVVNNKGTVYLLKENDAELFPDQDAHDKLWASISEGETYKVWGTKKRITYPLHYPETIFPKDTSYELVVDSIVPSHNHNDKKNAIDQEIKENEEAAKRMEADKKEADSIEHSSFRNKIGNEREKPKNREQLK